MSQIYFYDICTWNTKVYPLSFSEQAPARANLLSNHPFALLSLRGLTPRALNQTKSPDETGHFVWQGHVESVVAYGSFGIILQPCSMRASVRGFDYRTSPSD
jgi:hypothetical protein